MSAMGAFFWVVIATCFFVFMISVAAMLRDGATADPVVGGMSQLVGYGLALFAILRIYAPEENLGRVVAAQKTTPLLYVLGALIGLALILPINDIYEVLTRLSPESQPDELPKMLEEATTASRVMVGVSLALIAPLAEETIFRGALFSLLKVMARESSLFASPRGLAGISLRDDDASPARRSSGVESIIVTTILFALIHLEWQRMVPILFMGAVFGLMRQRSGSIFPGMLAHIVFNGVAFGFLVFGVEAGPPLWVSIASGALGLALITVFVLVARKSSAAATARGAEL